jgi:glycosyltransferase involved in cell wall biosynthesis
MAQTMEKLPDFDFEIVCVDDGSRDNTLEQLIAISKTDPRVSVLEFSRNFGKEPAMTAGIDAAAGDCVIPIDADLQDPPALISQMLQKWQEGAEVVLAKRIDRSTDTYAKRTTALMFYRLHNALSHLQIPENVGDYRLMDRVVVDALKQLPERQRFMKGLFAWVGFKTVTVDYSREARLAGESKFSGWKLWNFAIEGITSFSLAPLKVWVYIGSFGALFAFIYASFIVIRTLIFGIDLPGYASLLVVTLFFASLQLISLGVIGEYIGRIYFESKQRPLYLIRKKYSSKE